MKKLQDYFKSKSEELMASFNSSAWQNASKNQGDNRELFIRQFLEKVLPHRLRVVSGELFDKNLQQSGQLDTIIVKDDCPSLEFGQEHSYFSGGAFAVIEIKSNLTTGNKGTLMKALQSLDKVRKLQNPPAQILIGKMNTIPSPLKVIFAYTSTAKLATIEKFAKDNGLESNYDLICVLDEGAIIGPQLQSDFWQEFIIKEENIGKMLSNILYSKSISLGLLYYYLVENAATFLIGSSSISDLFKDIANWE